MVGSPSAAPLCGRRAALCGQGVEWWRWRRAWLLSGRRPWGQRRGLKGLNQGYWAWGSGPEAGGGLVGLSGRLRRRGGLAGPGRAPIDAARPARSPVALKGCSSAALRKPDRSTRAWAASGGVRVLYSPEKCRMSPKRCCRLCFRGMW